MGNRGISEKQRKILDTINKIPEFSELNFYLAGGCGLILYLNHRISIDADFFSGSNFEPQKLEDLLSNHFKCDAISKSKGTLHIKLNDIPCSFFYYSYKLLKKEMITDIPVASILDIASMKLSAIVSRGSKKDFIDLYYILESGISFQQIWDSYKYKFQVNDKQLYQIIISLVYFEDADKEPLFQEIENEWKKIKSYFHQLVKKIQHLEI
jgi:hypothetical protein